MTVKPENDPTAVPIAVVGIGCRCEYHMRKQHGLNSGRILTRRQI